MIDLTPVGGIVGILGLLAGGGLLNQVWGSLFRPRGQKTSETISIAELSAAFRKEIREENVELRARMEVIVTSLNTLTNCWDDLSPKILGLSAAERERLRQANNAAKIVA